MRKAMKHIRLLVVMAALLAGIGPLAAVPAAVSADPTAVVCGTLGAGSDCKNQSPNGVDLDKTIRTVVDILSMVVGIIAVIMIIISGLKFITANGDSGSIKSARQTLTYALVGVVVVAAAQALVQFVLHRVTQ